MVTASAVNRLRAMAAHRGLKLLRSRKRTPGVGDYGKFGLTDAAGKAVLGIEARGLSATAEEIEDYLRLSSKAAWKRAAETTVRLTPKKKAAARERASSIGPAPATRKATGEHGKMVTRSKAGQQTRAQADRPARSKPDLRIVATQKPAPPSEIALTIRNAKASDAPALTALLAALAGSKGDRAAIERALPALRGGKAGLLVAEKDGLVACCAWAAVPTLHRGPLGRITLLIVAESHRRSGIATALVSAAQAALTKAGCSAVEVMSDIRIENSHNFFRTLRFEQQSYRFVRTIE